MKETVAREEMKEAICYSSRFTLKAAIYFSPCQTTLTSLLIFFFACFLWRRAHSHTFLLVNTKKSAKFQREEKQIEKKLLHLTLNIK